MSLAGMTIRQEDFLRKKEAELLDIIVTHYKEPWEVGKKFFDMLACQRGVNFSDFKVILVHDGTPMFEPEVFSGYPYKVAQCVIPHAGVSAARNCGLARATDTWIQFCDFDDMYTNAYALQAVLGMMNRDVDYMWTPFITEYEKNGKIETQISGKENVIFVHGKWFRRQWLLDNEITFPVGIHYSEDSAFCAIVNQLAQPGRRGKITFQMPLYAWISRKDSVSMDPKNVTRNLTGFIDRNFYVVEEFKRRGIPYTLMVGRMFMDAYHAFHQAKRKFPAEEWWFVEQARKYIPELAKLKRDEMEELYKAAGHTFRSVQMDYNETFAEWFTRVTGRKAIAI